MTPPPHSTADSGLRAQADRAEQAALLRGQDQDGILQPRFEANRQALMGILSSLYSTQPGYDDWVHGWLAQLAACMEARPEELRELDRQRPHDWCQAPELIGYCAYVDRFAGTLRGVADKIPYLHGLGVRYLHLLPFLRARAGDNDGGFAVSDYAQVDPRFGADADLEYLAGRLRASGISLCMDLVLNHTADDHPWALAAQAGDPHYQRYYRLFPDRALPDRYERTLHQVFPRTAPGNFTWVEALQQWVWTTFYPFQWDLDWRNPEVFGEMSLAMLRLANRGVEAFRLDSTAYLWKREGTDGMNQPEAHQLLQALRLVAAIAAPAVRLKAEAIVPMQQLTPYFGDPTSGNAECHLAYHSTLMAGAWAALAEQRGELLRDIALRTPALPIDSAWLTYVRCHDDIGWSVLQEEALGDATRPGFDLRRVSDFFAGKTPGSYARGQAFQADGAHPVHGSNGMTAALAGIQAASEDSGDPHEMALALRRMLLLYGVAFAAPGVPLIYMGDELALGNDPGYRDDPARRHEGRWLHRPAMDWALASQRDQADSVPGRMHAGLRQLTRARLHPAMPSAALPMQPFDLEAPALFGFRRGERFAACFNFGEQSAAVDIAALTGERDWRTLLEGDDDNATLQPWGMRWWWRA